jgi:hypothetical protein
MHLAARRRLVSPLRTSRGHTREFQDFYRARSKRILTRVWRGHAGGAFLKIKSGKSTIAATANRFGAFLIASAASKSVALKIRVIELCNAFDNGVLGYTFAKL